jgi:pimeloyl-ACP methyl ester carboxylesterase
MQSNRCCLTGVGFFRAGIACWAALAAVALAAVVGFQSPAFGQAKETPAKSSEKPPKPEKVDRKTDDSLQLMLTYYPGASREAIQDGKGKRVVPIVLLHGAKQSRSDFESLALDLQKRGYAVIVPDLRGHGDSTHWIGSNRDDKLDAAKMPPVQYGFMVTHDMKAIKDFLWEKNNAGELNIDKLCVVGSEMGASVALGFAAFDAVGYGSGAYYGPRKLGRFVKAVVLISPKWTLPGLSISQVIKNPVVQSDIAIMILVGKKNAKSLKEAERIYGAFERWHPEPTGADESEKLDRQTLILGKIDTKLQGKDLLDRSFNVESYIADFCHRRLIKSDAAREWGWKERKTADE